MLLFDSSPFGEFCDKTELVCLVNICDYYTSHMLGLLILMDLMVIELVWLLLPFLLYIDALS